MHISIPESSDTRSLFVQVLHCPSLFDQLIGFNRHDNETRNRVLFFETMVTLERILLDNGFLFPTATERLLGTTMPEYMPSFTFVGQMQSIHQAYLQPGSILDIDIAEISAQYTSKILGVCGGPHHSEHHGRPHSMKELADEIKYGSPDTMLYAYTALMDCVLEILYVDVFPPFARAFDLRPEAESDDMTLDAAEDLHLVNLVTRNKELARMSAHSENSLSAANLNNDPPAVPKSTREALTLYRTPSLYSLVDSCQTDEGMPGLDMASRSSTASSHTCIPTVIVTNADGNEDLKLDFRSEVESTFDVLDSYYNSGVNLLSDDSESALFNSEEWKEQEANAIQKEQEVVTQTEHEKAKDYELKTEDWFMLTGLGDIRHLLTDDCRGRICLASTSSLPDESSERTLVENGQDVCHEGSIDWKAIHVPRSTRNIEIKAVKPKRGARWKGLFEGIRRHASLSRAM
jgi:hypothetical protein